MKNSEVVFALDIGSTKVMAVAGKMDEWGNLEVLGVGGAPALGMRRGKIVDIEGIATAVHGALNELRASAGLGKTFTYIGYSGVGVQVTKSFAYTMVTNPRREITDFELGKALAACKIVKLPAGRKVLHIITGDFTIDGCAGIMDPVGMRGSRLEVETTIVSAPTVDVQNLLKSAELAGCGANRVVLSILGSSVVLGQEEKEMGVALADMGAGVTTVEIFANGKLCYIKALPIGGDHVTGDLAIGLRTTLINAEEIKLKHGFPGDFAVSDKETVEVGGIGGQAHRKVTKKVISSIIDPRLQEIFDLIKNVIVESGFDGALPCGIVFVGGGSLLPGFADMAARRLDMPARLGVTGQSGAFGNLFSDPACAPALGLLDYGLRSCTRQEKQEKRSVKENLFDKAKNWLQYALNSE